MSLNSDKNVLLNISCRLFYEFDFENTSYSHLIGLRCQLLVAKLNSESSQSSLKGKIC